MADLTAGTPSAGAADVESLQALIRAQGVSGAEEPVRRQIEGRLPAGARPETDNLGNLILILGSGHPVRLLVAVMDEPGYRVSRIQEDGYLRVQRLSRLPLPPLYDQFLMGQPIQIGTTSPDHPLSAVSAVLSTHLQRGRLPDRARARPPTDEDLIIDVGARNATEAEAAGVRILAPVTLAKELTLLAGSRVAGPALDDRVGCEVLLELALKLHPRRMSGELILAWSAQSWVGFRGAERLARRFSPDEVLVVDPYAPDPPGFPVRAPGGVLGKGPFLAREEEGSDASAGLGARLRQVARRESIPIQSVVYGTLHDGTAFTGRSVAVMGVPLRFPGTAAEMVDMTDVEALERWMAAYLEEIP